MDNILFKRLELEANIKTLREKLDDLEEEKCDLLYNCNHEITITTATIGVPKEYLSFMAIPRTYCLLCKKQLGPKRHIPEVELKKMKRAVSIQLDDYPKFVEKWKEISFKKVEEIYLEKRAEFPEISETEIAAKIIEEMK